VEEDHVPPARMTEVIRNENLTFTPEELAHFNQCDDCFDKWAECVSTVSAEEPDGSGK
jgi:hypothetical protein